MKRRLSGLLGTLGILAAFALAAVLLVPAALGMQRYVITTGSMADSLDPGSLIFDERVPVADVRVGDVITFRPPTAKRALVTHRVHAISRDAAGRLSFRTKGDANRVPDAWTFVPRDGMLNRVEAHVPHLGRAYAFLNSGTGRVLVFMIPGLLIALASLAALWREAGDATRTPAPTQVTA